MILFLASHFAMLVGVTSPEKFYFDEVHYVPAARQMLEQVAREPMLNPMHPPLAKQMIALSINTFGDNPLGWRYPGTLFGALAIVAVYLGGLALFRAQGPAISASLIAFCNQMLFVQSRIAMLDISALAFSLFAVAAFITASAKGGRILRSRSRAPVPAFQSPANGAACSCSPPASSSSRGAPDARLAHAVRKRQSR